MSEHLLTVEQAARHLELHPKTVLRYIREGALPAAKIGKSYRIARADLDAFAGLPAAAAKPEPAMRATCTVDVPAISPEAAGRAATLLSAAAMNRDGSAPPLHLSSAFDPQHGTLKVVAIGDPADVARLLELLQLQLKARP